MRLPNGDRAIIPEDKLLGYILNEDHPHQPGHAALFRILLGITPANAHVLRDALREAAAEQPAAPGTPSRHGVKHDVSFTMDGRRGRYTVLSVWIIGHAEEVPRLVTAYIA